MIVAKDNFIEKKKINKNKNKIQMKIAYRKYQVETLKEVMDITYLFPCPKIFYITYIEPHNFAQSFFMYRGILYIGV